VFIPVEAAIVNPEVKEVSVCGALKNVLDAEVIYSSMKILKDAMRSVFNAATNENWKE
jgi:hypothetical protein